MTQADRQTEINDTIDEVLGGDTAAFLKLAQIYGPKLRIYFASRISDPATVDDLVQETFIAAYQTLDRFDRSANFTAWIRGIARNRMLLHLRSIYATKKAMGKLRNNIVDKVSPELAALEGEDQELRLQLLRRCIRKLPERSHELVEARYLRGESVTAIANQLQTTVSAISSTLYRVKQRLGNCIREGLPA